VKRTREQKAAIESRARSLCVDAGAGSGKTSVLVERVVHLLEHRLATLDEIVAITFTEKAAAEMKDRLRRACRARAPRDDPDEMTRWRELERRVETSRISTIHAFCAALLRENALRIGIDPDFVLLADAEATLLRGEVVRESVNALLDAEDGPATRAATEMGARRLIGELERMLGKRAVMQRLAQQHPLDDAEKLRAHWRRLVDEAQAERLRKLAGSRTVREWCDRLASLGDACLNDADPREVLRCGMVDLLDEIRQAKDVARIRTLIEAVCALKLKRGTRKNNWEPREAFDEVKQLQETVLKGPLSKCIPEEVAEEIEERSAKLACDIYATYERVEAAFQEAKNARTSLDFDDLLIAAHAMLRDNEEVRARTARSIRHLLIDEFQDTDSVQLAIARLLADHPEGPDLFFVGDAKQSIYDFRGAEVEVFENEKREAAEIIPLRRNFRTVPDVLTFVNEVFARSGLLDAVEPEYARLEAHREAVDRQRIEFLIPQQADEALALDDYRAQEAGLIAARIEDMCAGAEPVQVQDAAGLRPAGFGDVAMLFRSMSSVYIYEEGLRARGIPYTVVAGAGFYERQEVIDLRNLLAVLIDPWDEMALLGFLRGPIGALSDESLVRLCAGSGVVPGFWADAIPEGLAQEDRLVAARTLVAELRAHTAMPLPAFLRLVLDRTGYEAIVLSQHFGIQKASNVRKLLDLAEDFARTRQPGLSAFVRCLDEVAAQEIREGDAALQPEGAESVTLMSIHMAKGLEFRIVVIPDAARARQGPRFGDLAVHRRLGLAAGVHDAVGEPGRPAILSAIRSACDDQDRAEHARILYVAMTRARDWLLMGGAPKPGKDSWLGVLDEHYGLLQRADGDTVSGEGWSAKVRRQHAPRPIRTRPRAQIEEPAAPEALARRAEPVAVATPSRKSFAVSELLDLMHEPNDQKSNGTPPAPSGIDPALRGTVVHRMFELWDFTGKPPVEALLVREYPALSLDEPFRAYLSDVATRFAESRLGHQIAHEQNVQREMPFLLRVGDAVVSGTIDLLLEDGTLIDYKTGARHADAHTQYEWQLRLYAAAVRQLTPLRPPRAFVYYADLGEDCEVDTGEAMLDEGLAKAARAIDTLRQRPPAAPPTARFTAS